jgi:hypothetical protein
VSRFTLAITLSAITLLSVGVVWLTNSRAAADPTGLADTTPQGPGLERYVDPVSGFFFDYPAGLKLFVTDNGEDRVIFGDSPEGETHFMIVFYPYPFSEPLTEDTIREQFGAEITSPIEHLALPSGDTAFLSGRDKTSLGATRDALFTHNGTAYQVSVVAHFDELLDRILQTWRFTSAPTL